MKSFRQSLVLELVDQEAITSQEQLRERLRARGIEATQATLSRDIRDLGLVKAAADGAYKRPQAGDAAAPGPDAAAVLRPPRPGVAYTTRPPQPSRGRDPGCHGRAWPA